MFKLVALSFAPIWPSKTHTPHPKFKTTLTNVILSGTIQSRNHQTILCSWLCRVNL